MRADVAPFVLDLLLGVGGLGLLVGFGVVPIRASSMLAAFGLAYLTGAAAIPLVMTILVIIGIPFTIVTFAIVTLACISGMWFGLRRPAPPTPATEPWWRQHPRSWQAERWVVVAFILAFGTFAVVGMLDAFSLPLLGWDSWAFYGRKAEMLTWYDTLIHGFWPAPQYSLIHADYPLQLPAFEALHFRAGGVADTATAVRHIWLLLVAFVWGAAYLLKDRARAVVWAPLLLLAALAPAIWIQTLEGNADVPMALYAGMGAAALALWVSEVRDGGRYLPLAVVMLGAAANTKNEGLMVAVALILVAGVVAWQRRLPIRHFLIACGVLAITVLPWRLYMSAHGIRSDLPVSKGIDPGYMLPRADRIWPSIRVIGHDLAEQDKWLYLLPLAVLVVLAALISGIGRRAAAFYAATFLVVTAGYIWTYWLSQYQIGYHLETSVPRVISVLMLIAVAALVHISGLLLSALLAQRQASGDVG
jgi:hypothetical protein